MDKKGQGRHALNMITAFTEEIRDEMKRGIQSNYNPDSSILYDSKPTMAASKPVQHTDAKAKHLEHAKHCVVCLREREKWVRLMRIAYSLIEEIEVFNGEDK